MSTHRLRARCLGGCRRCRLSGRVPQGHSSESTRCRRPCAGRLRAVDEPPQRTVPAATARPSGGPRDMSGSSPTPHTSWTDSTVGRSAPARHRRDCPGLRVDATGLGATPMWLHSRRLRRASGSELAEDRRDVVVDRAAREEESLGDLSRFGDRPRPARGLPSREAVSPNGVLARRTSAGLAEAADTALPVVARATISAARKCVAAQRSWSYAVRSASRSSESASARAAS